MSKKLIAVRDEMKPDFAFHKAMAALATDWASSAKSQNFQIQIFVPKHFVQNICKPMVNQMGLLIPIRESCAVCVS